MNAYGKMREALELCSRIINDNTIVCACDLVDEAKEKVKQALSTPVRNCCKYANETEAQFACLGESLANGVHSVSLTEYHKWLFSETKGECNESKKEEA